MTRHRLVQGALLLAAIAAIVAAPSFLPGRSKGDQLPLHSIILSHGERKMDLRVEFARTGEEQERGLMNRTVLDHGMLFLFAEPRPLSFWMKNTRIPLDIVFFGDDGRFVSSLGMEPCGADPCPLYRSAGKAQYALEMPKGFVSRSGIGEGWGLQLPL